MFVLRTRRRQCLYTLRYRLSAGSCIENVTRPVVTAGLCLVVYLHGFVHNGYSTPSHRLNVNKSNVFIAVRERSPARFLLFSFYLFLSLSKGVLISIVIAAAADSQSFWPIKVNYDADTPCTGPNVAPAIVSVASCWESRWRPFEFMSCTGQRENITGVVETHPKTRWRDNTRKTNTTREIEYEFR